MVKTSLFSFSLFSFIYLFIYLFFFFCLQHFQHLQQMQIWTMPRRTSLQALASHPALLLQFLPSKSREYTSLIAQHSLLQHSSVNAQNEYLQSWHLWLLSGNICNVLFLKCMGGTSIKMGGGKGMRKFGGQNVFQNACKAYKNLTSLCCNRPII